MLYYRSFILDQLAVIPQDPFKRNVSNSAQTKVMKNRFIKKAIML